MTVKGNSVYMETILKETVPQPGANAMASARQYIKAFKWQWAEILTQNNKWSRHIAGLDMELRNCMSNFYSV